MHVCVQVSELCGGQQKPTWGSTLNYTLGVEHLTFQDTPLCPLTIKPCGCPDGTGSLVPIHIIDGRDVPAFTDAKNQMAAVASHDWDRQEDVLRSYLNDQGVISDSEMDIEGVPVDQQDSNEYQFADRPPIAIPDSALRLQTHTFNAIPYWASEPFVPLTLP